MTSNNKCSASGGTGLRFQVSEFRGHTTEVTLGLMTGFGNGEEGHIIELFGPGADRLGLKIDDLEAMALQTSAGLRKMSHF